MSSVRKTTIPDPHARTNQQFQPINPKPFLKTLLNKQVIVRLKWNKTEYKGTLLSIDNYMNLQLDETYEVIRDENGKREEKIGEIFIRCNNVLFVREDPDSMSEEA
ncbi:putative small nuclear ribonucleoprotein F [Clavispora lusitaniae]|uniref:Sm protein F n=2 Tax=Clavispora lusitaniae TaxID=36911 RepID=A0AA91Q293_CLALS|nr:putative mRNA splicing protein [Clavispora lusitaniae]QFZ29876.1 putative small nuclear ribonucleoprotein F [Clavispora lusitaniae]QFZ35526.1 putative small nuclear ribonucleoprotein F [Clavispora lusitaniae]QFZ41220.1 putative small nuclear ribonucleoprotein F [Clavispora lusitaniae]QFZ46901.1 putative small nuclear ribonucleoprotein F [Clavispora lusitaniae]